MATLKITSASLKKAQSSIRKTITKALRSKDIRAGIGDIVVDAIKASKLGSPAKATVAHRKYLEKYNQTSDAYKRGVVNAIFTGELMKDLANNVKFTTGSDGVGYEIQNSGKKHKKYKGKKKSIGSRTPYKVIQDRLIDLGYDYLFIEDETVDKLVKFIRKQLLNKLS